MNKNSDEKQGDIDLHPLPFSQACENNKEAILAVLQKELKDARHVLEIGSGTGQHSVYFAPDLPHLEWQTSDVSLNYRIIQAWHNAYPAPNLHQPIRVDLTEDSKPILFTNTPYDAVFTANTLHIIAWPLIERLFVLARETLASGGKLIIYGPFNEAGSYTSTSNESFDLSLRRRDPSSGIRHKEDIVSLATQQDFALSHEYQMPANNQILVFIRQ